MGNLATLQPPLSPMLRTSIATGKRPLKHGIHVFSEPDSHSGGARPITNLSRKRRPSGTSSTRPATPRSSSAGRPGINSPLSGTAHPEEIRDRFRTPDGDDTWTPSKAPHPLPPRAETVVVVTGLPRSGTSMMMRMLAAGGVATFAVDHRPADEPTSPFRTA